jgi:hypothetical protein
VGMVPASATLLPEVALHPRLRCVPLRVAPLLWLRGLARNGSWYAKNNHCVVAQTDPARFV